MITLSIARESGDSILSLDKVCLSFRAEHRRAESRNLHDARVKQQNTLTGMMADFSTSLEMTEGLGRDDRICEADFSTALEMTRGLGRDDRGASLEMTRDDGRFLDFARNDKGAWSR